MFTPFPRGQHLLRLTKHLNNSFFQSVQRACMLLCLCPCAAVWWSVWSISLCAVRPHPHPLSSYIPLFCFPNDTHIHTLTQNLPQTLPTAGLHHNKFRLERHMPLVESTIIRPPMLGPMGVVAAKEFLHLLLLRLGNWPLFSFAYRTNKWYSVSRAESRGFFWFWTILGRIDHKTQNSTTLKSTRNPSKPGVMLRGDDDRHLHNRLGRSYRSFGTAEWFICCSTRILDAIGCVYPSISSVD